MRTTNRIRRVRIRTSDARPNRVVRHDIERMRAGVVADARTMTR